MFQHIFWFFGHPEVYIMILPGFGIISHIVPAFSRKPLFGYASMVYATAAIAIVSVIVWAHHMFTTGMPVTAQLFFMYATMWRGAITLEAPMLFAIGFIWVFTIGDFSGLLLSVVPCWTRVAPPSGRRPLTGVEACGIRVEVGSFIGEKARRRVALELRQQLRIAAMPA